MPDKPTNIPSLLQQEIKVGIFAWAVLLGYGLFGEKFVSRARGKGVLSVFTVRSIASTQNFSINSLRRGWDGGLSVKPQSPGCFFCFAPGLWSMLRWKPQGKGSLVIPRQNGCKSLTYHGRLLSANVPNSPHEALRPRPGIAIHSGAINDFCKRFNIPNGLRQVCIWCVHGFSLSHYENNKAAVPNSGFFYNALQQMS